MPIATVRCDGLTSSIIVILEAIIQVYFMLCDKNRSATVVCDVQQSALLENLLHSQLYPILFKTRAINYSPLLFQQCNNQFQFQLIVLSLSKVPSDSL